MTITGRTIAEELADVPAAPRTDQDVIRPWSTTRCTRRAISRSCKGNLAPEGCVAKITGLKNPVDHRPGARVRFRDRR